MSQDIRGVGKDVRESKAGSVLVACIDRDDDVGAKAGITTPVVGRDACIDAAQRLALEDPEDADSNAIFAAVKTYEDLLSRGYRAEVAVIAGAKERGMRADEKIVRETRGVLETFDAAGVVIVSDGEDDESVIPVVQNILPVVSVQRVVMQVSRTIEHSYAVFGKYLKMIMYDPKYSKFALGVPGILMLIGGIAAVLGYTTEIFAVLVIILAGAFIVRAFDIDRAWSNWTKPDPSSIIRVFTTVTGLVLIAASVPAGISLTDQAGLDVSAVLADSAVTGQFLAGVLPILWIGIGVMLAGMLIGHVISGARREITDTIRLIALASMYPTLAQFTVVLSRGESEFTLVPPLLAGLGATLAAVVILYRRYARGARGAEAAVRSGKTQ